MDSVALIEQHYNRIKDKLIKRYTRFAGTKEAAEDIVQESYYRALKYKDSYDPSMLFDTWFSRILRNALSHYKNMERGGAYEELDEEAVEGIAFSGYNKVLLDQIYEEMSDYTGESYEVLNLYFRYGYSPGEIKQVVEMKYKAIEQTIYRFKVYVRNKYGENVCS